MNKLILFFCILLISCNNKKKEVIGSNKEDSHEIITSEETQNTVDTIINKDLSFEKIDPSLYKGKIFTKLSEIPYFKNYTEGGGAMIDPLNDVEYGFLHYFKDNNHLIILMKIISADYNSVQYSALDMVKINNLPEKHYIYYGNCRYAKKHDSEIFSIIKYEDKEYFTIILKSWRADRLKGKIIEIDNNKIDCINAGYGV